MFHFHFHPLIISSVVTYLVSASLEEDRYGVVQRDIPKILETLISFLTALETYKDELDKKYAPPPLEGEDGPLPDQVIAAHEKATAELADATLLILNVHEGAFPAVILFCATLTLV